MKEIESIIFFFLVFTCKTDADCYGNGYCHARECKCSANYEYAQDCSHHGCKYIQQTFVFLFTLKWMYQYIPVTVRPRDAHFLEIWKPRAAKNHVS